MYDAGTDRRRIKDGSFLCRTEMGYKKKHWAQNRKDKVFHGRIRTDEANFISHKWQISDDGSYWDSKWPSKDNIWDIGFDQEYFR